MTQQFYSEAFTKKIKIYVSKILQSILQQFIYNNTDIQRLRLINEI